MHVYCTNKKVKKTQYSPCKQMVNKYCNNDVLS